ncbi:MAG: hypothetical protein ABSG52_11035 [Terriglobales bacterium]|jgi:hypothetical protein
MPRLLILAPCHSVLHDEEGHDASLISIIEGVKLTVLPGAPEPPRGTLVPMHWCVYACWQQEAGDPKDKQYEQRLLCKAPTGELIMETAPRAFNFETRMVNVINKFINFPVWQKGICPISAEYREVGTEQWVEVASYPLLIEHEVQPQKSDTTSKTVIWHKA